VKAGDVVAERFELLELIGSGGMGRVFRSHDRLTNRTVAVKSLLALGLVDEATNPEPSASEVQVKPGAETAWKVNTRHLAGYRLTQEARILATLNHEGIVRHIAHGVTAENGSDEPFLAMEWLEGEDLSARLSKGPLSVMETIGLAEKLLEGLAYMHEQRLIHRDLKPSNVFLIGKKTSDLRLIDFGLTIPEGELPDTGTSGDPIGTPAYMAPEQARGATSLTAAADVFALGALLYACLTGRKAFDGEDAMSILAKVLLEDPPRVSELRPQVSPTLDDWVMHMLEKDPTRRPRSALELLTKLRGLTTMTASGMLATLPGAALTTAERELLCCVAAGHPAADASARAAGRSSMQLHADVQEHRAELRAAEQALQALAEQYGGTLTTLADGSLWIIFRGTGTTTEQVVRAAQCALDLPGILPRWPIALVTGFGEVTHRVPVGELIDRASALLRTSSISVVGGDVPRVYVDKVSEALLGEQFEIRATREGAELLGACSLQTGAKTVLGLRTPCVGRDLELAQLLAALRGGLRDQLPRVLLLTADPGVGKSRLRKELVRQAQNEAENLQIWSVRGEAMTRQVPLAFLGQLVRDALGMRLGDSLVTRQELARAKAAIVWPEDEVHNLFLAEVVGAGYPDSEDVQLREARKNPQLMSDRLVEVVFSLIQHAAAEGPLLLSLENLHWCDAASQALLLRLQARVQQHPVVFLVTGWPLEPEAQLVDWAARAHAHVRLGPLPRFAAEQICAHSLGVSLDDEIVRKLVDRAAGNAFFLEELIRAAQAGQTESLPESILAVAQSRLADLSPVERRTLRAASILGEIFWGGAVVAMLGGVKQEEAVAASLRELVRRELIVEQLRSRYPGQEESAFTHDMVREVAYATLTQQDRTTGHRLAGEWLEGIGATDAVVLAHHAEEGRLPDRAVLWYKRAAAQALASNDFHGTLEFVERAHRLDEEGSCRGELRLLEAVAQRWHGQFAEAEEAALEASRLLPEGEDAWYEALAELANAAGKLAHHPRLAMVTALLNEPETASQASPARLGATCNAANECIVLGRYEEAEALLAVLKNARVSLREQPLLRAKVSGVRAVRALFAGDPSGAIGDMEAAVTAYQAAGDRRRACAESVNLGYLYIEVGAYERAEDVLRSTMLEAQRIGLPSLVGSAAHNLGCALLHLGRLEEAQGLEEDALLRFEVDGKRRMIMGTLNYLAQIYHARGDMVAAEASARKALEMRDVAKPTRANVLATMSQIALAKHDVEAAYRYAQEAMDILAELGTLDEGESVIRLSFAKAAYYRGRMTETEKTILTARDRVLERVLKLSNAAWRQGFLEDVPEHVEIMLWAAQIEAANANR
jgi:tetratricopeptide (TPR) repeat protein/predicted Ser/Thr protein kinase